MVGLVVTPTPEYSSTSDGRLPLRMRSRDRSSSQTATPAEESSASLSFCAMSLCLPRGLGAVLLQGPPHTVSGGVQRGPYLSPVGCGRPPVAATGPAGTAAPDAAASMLSRAAGTPASSGGPRPPRR